MSRFAGLQTWIPGVGVVRSYQRSWLGKDVIAGLVLVALLVPQGMAYAQLAGLPPITGLYTSILCLLGYAAFGPSRVLVLGPDSSLGPMIATILAPLLLANGDPERAVVLASVLAVMVGVLMTVAGIARFGFVADLLSKPTQVGYLTGLSLTILVGQLPKLLGFSVDADSFVDEARAVVRGIADGEVNATAAAVGLTSLVGLLVLQRLVPKLPGVLLVVVAAAVAVNLLDLQESGVETIGRLPQGLPPFTIPTVPWHDVPALAVGAFAISLVALADTMSTASAFAAMRGERVRGNQEMIGIGLANVAAGLFQGFPVSTSGSRTAVAEQAGARSQLTGVVGAVAIGLLLLFAPGAVQDVPQPTLGAVVIVAALSLAQLDAFRRLRQQRLAEFILALAAFVGVALFGVLIGIGIAVALSILNVFRRAWWPHQVELGRVSGLEGLHDVGLFPEAERLPGLLVYRFDAPLIFANARTFNEQLRELVEERPGLIWVVVAAEPITDVDTTAADMLEELDGWLNDRGISLVFAELKDPVRAKIRRYQLNASIAPEHFVRTVDAAVAQYIEQTGASWRPPAT